MANSWSIRNTSSTSDGAIGYVRVLSLVEGRLAEPTLSRLEVRSASLSWLSFIIFAASAIVLV